jgi:hypothetical protein
MMQPMSRIGTQTREQKLTGYPAGGRKPVNVMGEIIMCKVTSGETNGVCSMIEEVAATRRSTSSYPRT